MSYTLSPNMSLILPTVGVEPGPTWATDLNNSLSLVDTHDHSSGNGVPITPSGLSISSDLSFIGNNAISLRSVRFSSQNSPIALGTDLNCLSVSGVDLYYNDGLGNQIRITQSGSVAGASGSITGLTSPASVTYVSGTPAFVFQSAALTSANLDGGSLTIRENVASANGITIGSPTSLPAGYSLTLPTTLPGSQQILQVNSSGVISASNSVVGGVSITGGLTVASGGANITGANSSYVGDLTVNGDQGITGTLTVTGNVRAASVYPTGPSNAHLIGSTANTVDIVGPSTSHPIVVSGNPSSAGLMIVRGGVTSGGAIDFGEGFTSARLGVGVYRVTFSNTFLDAAAVTAVPRGAVLPAQSIYVGTAGTSVVDIVITLTNGAASDCAFSFIAIGQRNG